MKSVSATFAHNRFGQLIDMVQADRGWVASGRDVAVVMSPEQFRRPAETARGKVNLAVEHLHVGSVKRWASVYEGLAT